MARCGAEETANPTHGVSPRPEIPVEDLTPEVLPLCDIVPVGGVIAMEVSEPEVEFNRRVPLRLRLV
ncbi:hypothetical protein F2Q70_00003841 [Brassica cretica]|uniref:Uncharacterized protein n=1 Tax=Brassica cretica TaxID=69181 RepID=A0A8S9IZK3_BRACR|nr:hypothetical protein F2Q70_00003841 [Brassica cretica]KAF3560530.1 hypothetical protein DY000_02015756 [Brassica cretica]